MPEDIPAAAVDVPEDIPAAIVAVPEDIPVTKTAVPDLCGKTGYIVEYEYSWESENPG